MTVSSQQTDNRTAAASDERSPFGETLRTLRFRALGTDCTIQYAPISPENAASYEQAVLRWMELFEARYSRFRPHSIISLINHSAGGSWVEVDAETEQMLDICGMLHAMTGGILDATAGPLLRLWDYHRPTANLPDAAQVATARTLVGWDKVKRAPGRILLPRAGMALDLGGWGKEWAVDAVAELAGAFGIKKLLVDFGHDIRCCGTPPGRPAWHVGLEDPGNPGVHRGSIALSSNQGIASSGDYMRGFTRNGRRYGHIVDPRTGEPVANDCRQATVIAASCFQAGILSTTAFVLGPTKGLEFIQQFPGAEGVIVTGSSRFQTRGFWNHVAS